MKHALLYFILFMASFSLFSQKSITLESKIGETYDFSNERQALWSVCDSLFTGKFPTDRFTQEERNALSDKCSRIGFSEACDGFWGSMNSMGCGCSWYCGAQVTSVNVSSFLKGNNTITYNALSIGDLNYKTAWVEGVKGHGFGEFVVYEFPPLNPRITKIIIANGYIKDKKTWQKNSRAKQLKMYVDNKFYAILNLKDVYAEQTFEVSPIGYSQRKNITYKKDGTLIDAINGNIIPSLKIKFEISKVYKGDIYDDTAITEIYFDGIDVH